MISTGVKEYCLGPFEAGWPVSEESIENSTRK